jgi:hypothetical protein
MWVDSSNHANNRRLNHCAHTPMYADMCLCLVASSGAQIGQEQQQEQQQQVLLAQLSPVLGDYRVKT